MDKAAHMTEERLSAYHDGELRASEASEVASHLEGCPSCRARLEELDQLALVTDRLPEPVPQRDLWTGIEAALPAGASSRVRPWFGRPVWRVAAVAAFLAALLWALPTFTSIDLPILDEGRVETARAFGFDYGTFLDGLNEPAEMELFDRAYGRLQLSIEEALSAADVPVDRDLLERIPAGLDLKAVYVLSNETARAVQVSYGHNDGEIAVFTQPAGLPVRFAGYRIEPAAIGTKQCLMVDTGRYCAITFSSGEAQYVVIGRNDDMKVARVLDELLAAL